MIDTKGNRNIFLDLLSQDVKRDGIESLKMWLVNETDFFTAPCSRQYHLNEEGGLVQHSLNVFKLLLEKVGRYKIKTLSESITICGLCHDLCKANFYIKGTKNVKENGIWKAKEIWIVKDQFPFGHGEKSVSLLQRHIDLTEEEALAIRWHMVAFDAGIHFSYPSGFAFREASKRYPLVTLLFTADYEASQIVEREEINHAS